jgi:hypothetical protein
MPKNSKQSSFSSTLTASYVGQKKRTQQRINTYLKRRPHRSFRRTDPRDYRRSLVIPGYWALTAETLRVLWKHRTTFVLLGVLYAVLAILLLGFGSQSTYTSIVESLQQQAEQAEVTFNPLEQAGLIFVSLSASGFGGGLAADQQIYAVIVLLLVWLTTVWLLRQLLAGNTVKLRDGLYNASAPIVPLFLLVLVLLLQSIPLLLAGVGYVAAESAGMLDGGVEAMMFWIAAGLATLLTLYWAASTLFAMVIVTLPGTYPLHALRMAGDVVLGRRLRLLLRSLWAIVLIGVLWAVVLIPVIMFDSWLKVTVPGTAWVPLVPGFFLILTVVSVIWSAAYVYILYRKVIDSDPA